MNKNNIVGSIFLCFAAFASTAGNAALIGRDLDGELTTAEAYYDTALNITWLQNWNLAATQTFGVAGISTLGQVNWGTANGWIVAMNAASYFGQTGWRLPTVIDSGAPGYDFGYSGTDGGYNVDPSTGEMAHLFYVTLGNDAIFDTAGNPQAGGATNSGPFAPFQGSYYWSGTRFVGRAPGPSAWAFYFSEGFQGPVFQSGPSGAAWAVHSGDIGRSAVSVPEPTSLALLGLGLAGLGLARRKRAA